MEEKKIQQDVIDIKECVDFLKRRKWCVIITTVFCLVASWIYALRAPTTYTISAIIKPPSVDSPENLATKINERVFGGDVEEIIDALGAKAMIIGETGLIRIYFKGKNGKYLEKHTHLLNSLTAEFYNKYQGEVDSERQSIEQRISAINDTQSKEEGTLKDYINTVAESGDHATAVSLHLLYNKLLSLKSFFAEETIQELEQLKSEIQNIEVVKEPHISKIVEPRMNLSLAIAGFTGIIAGIVIGVIKDYYSPGKNFKTRGKSLCA